MANATILPVARSDADNADTDQPTVRCPMSWTTSEPWQPTRNNGLIEEFRIFKAELNRVPIPRNKHIQC